MTIQLLYIILNCLSSPSKKPVTSFSIDKGFSLLAHRGLNPYQPHRSLRHHRLRRTPALHNNVSQSLLANSFRMADLSLPYLTTVLLRSSNYKPPQIFRLQTCSPDCATCNENPKKLKPVTVRHLLSTPSHSLNEVCSFVKISPCTWPLLVTFR